MTRGGNRFFQVKNHLFFSECGAGTALRRNLGYSKHEDVLRAGARWISARRIVILEYGISMQLRIRTQTIGKHC